MSGLELAMLDAQHFRPHILVHTDRTDLQIAYVPKRRADVAMLDAWADQLRADGHVVTVVRKPDSAKR